MRSAMEYDPFFEPQTVVHSAPEGLVDLWLDALRQDGAENDIVCQTALGLVRLKRLGITVERPAINELARQLSRPDLEEAARLTAARALVELDAKEHAAVLAAQLTTGGRDMAEIVEPALARWRDPMLGEQWLKRLKAPDASSRSLQLAIRGVGALRNLAAREPLMEIAADRSRSLIIRLAAAETLGTLCDNGLEQYAGRLLSAQGAAQPSVRLIAAMLLSRHSGQASEELLSALSTDENAAVAVLAVKRLLRIHPALLESRRAWLLHHQDSTIRMLGIEAVLTNPGSDAAAALSERLDDGRPDVRSAAVKALVKLADDAARRKEVCQETAKLLDAEFPRRTEQALLVLGLLDHEPSTMQVLDLLEATDARVATTAGWTLERLATPDSGEKILARVVRESARTVEIARSLGPARAGDDSPERASQGLGATYQQLEHLLLALGQLRYEKAAPHLRSFIAKPSWQPGDPPLVQATSQARPRAAAIWALGKIYAGQGAAAPTDLLLAITDRMADDAPIPREEPIVRRMAAISLGRIGAPGSLSTIRKFFSADAGPDDVGRACGWAIEQMSGVAPQRISTRTIRHADWFLVPLGPALPKK